MVIFNKKNISKGFTLVETLIAVSIFSLSVTVMMSVLANSIADTNYAKQKMIATYLAQEGVEYIRSLRDTYKLYHQPDGWDGFRQALIIGGCNLAGGCYLNDLNIPFDSPTASMVEDSIGSSEDFLVLSGCGNNNCPYLKQDLIDGQYNISNGTDTIFVRQINTTVSSNNQEVKVSSKVTWRQGSGTYQITFTETLFNWVE